MWFSYPWVGTETPSKKEAQVGISDYFASVFNRRGIASRVVRTDGHTLDGIDYLLEGQLDHFVGVMNEAHPTPDPVLHHGYDVRVLGLTAVTLTLTEVASGELVWRGNFSVFDELLTVDEPIVVNHPTRREQTFQIYGDHFAYWAHTSMQEHAERALRKVTLDILADMEGVLAPGDRGPISGP